MMDARMEAYGKQFPINFIGGPYDGQFGATKQKVNEVKTQTTKHPNCFTYVTQIYERAPIGDDIFVYREEINPIEGCKRCEAIVTREAKYKAEEAERNAFREFQKTIDVIYQIGDDGGWDWSEAQIGKSPDGRIWIRYGSGCSCDSIDMVDWEALTDRAQALSASRHLDATPIERANFIAKAQELLGERN